MLPASGLAAFRCGRPAESITTLTAKGRAALARSRFARMVSIDSGLMTGRPMPPYCCVSAHPCGNTRASSPSPKLAAMPVCAAAAMQQAL